LQYVTNKTSLEKSMGFPSGGRSLALRLRMAERNRLLREFAARQFPGLSGRALIDACAVTAAAYLSRAWPREQIGGLPMAFENTPRALLYRAAVLGSLPESQKQWRRIVAGHERAVLMSANQSHVDGHGMDAEEIDG